jgi:hypothetical protein
MISWFLKEMEINYILLKNSLIFLLKTKSLINMIGILQFKKNIKDKEDYQEVKVLLHGLHKKKK